MRAADFALLEVAPHVCVGIRPGTTLRFLRNDDSMGYDTCFLETTDGRIFHDSYVLWPSVTYGLRRPRDVYAAWGFWCPHISAANVLERS